MSAKKTRITLTHGSEAQQTVQDLLLAPSSKPRTSAQKVARYFEGSALGNRSCKYDVEVNSGDEVQATGTITLSSFAAEDTVTIGTQTFTSKASPSGANEFLSTGGDTVVAAALVVKINAHTSLTRVVSATSSLGVVTLTCATPGLVGNQIGIAISAHGSVSGGGKLGSGANATTYSSSRTYHLGV